MINIIKMIKYEFNNVLINLEISRVFIFPSFSILEITIFLVDGKNREKHSDRVQDANESDEGGESDEDSIPSLSPAMSVVSGETDVSVARRRIKKTPRLSLSD